jgi:hypothetical protein
MKITNIKTFRTLLIKDGMKAKELAQLVQVNGTHYINRWGDWEASLPGNTETKDIIETALNEIADYVSAYIYNDSERTVEHHDFFTHHPLDNFGFAIGKDNELLVENTALQTSQELISQLQSELASTKQSAKTKSNKDRYAKEKEAVQKAAKRLWEEDDTLTIVDITLHDDINKTTKPNGKNFSEGTLREWTRDLAPSNKPGRRKNK